MWFGPAGPAFSVTPMLMFLGNRLSGSPGRSALIGCLKQEQEVAVEGGEGRGVLTAVIPAHTHTHTHAEKKWFLVPAAAAAWLQSVHTSNSLRI